MQLVDMIEKRRFVGREFLLYLWMESELFESTLSTREHGSFGLWIERKLVLSAGKESTRITSPMPGVGRDAKEALLRGQLPESAGIRIAWKDDETSLSLEGERFAIAGLKLKTLLPDAGEAFSGDLVDEMMGKKPGKPKKKESDEDDDTPFYERMTLTRELETLLATLYRDFLALRLSSRWDGTVVPALQRWAIGKPVDVEAYRAARAPQKEAKPAPRKAEKEAKPAAKKVEVLERVPEKKAAKVAKVPDKKKR